MTDEFNRMVSRGHWRLTRGPRAADLADGLMGAVNRRLGCDSTATFDRAAARLAEFELLP